MLRTTIQTKDAATGKELPIPPDLLAKVRHANDLLQQVLRRVGEKFDIDVRWEFDVDTGTEPGVWLNLSTPTTPVDRSVTWRLPNDSLRDADSIRRNLWTPLWQLSDVLSGELDRDLERIRRSLQELANDSEA